nr:MAG TPA: hypothetical protein [Caudoviricetes sp.]
MLLIFYCTKITAMSEVSGHSCVNVLKILAFVICNL